MTTTDRTTGGVPASDTGVATLDDLIAEQERRFLARTARSAEIGARGATVMPGGVTSSWASSKPLPVWVSHGEGGLVWDVDGTEYVDFHGGYGVNVVGHAHPAVVAQVQQRVTRGTHFAQPTEDAIVVAEALAARFDLPMWRFTNSGTESTMDAIHLMRAITGRPLVVKVEGTYHGHHDAVMVSAFRSSDQLGPADDPHRVAGPGVPQMMADLVRLVPFNDLVALERVLAAHEGQVAGMILEPMMMNAGIIPPAPGYLEGVRDLVHRHGALLAFDEVKTGMVVDWGGATRRFGVRPDIVCLAKALGGGIPCGAIGGTHEVMSAITEGRYDQIGTFNGNPLTMAAARAVLTEVLVPEVYDVAEQRGRRMLDAARASLAAHGHPSYGNVFGFKGSVVFHDTPATDYRSFLEISTALSHCHFLVQHNGGVFLPPWGKSESWTMSVAHTDAHGERYVANVAELGRLVAPLVDRSSQLYAVGSYS
ncbi:MAG: aspartate aminotransferase family protein [Ilumatobacteraceae bacterium]